MLSTADAVPNRNVGAVEENEGNAPLSATTSSGNNNKGENNNKQLWQQE